MPWQHAWLRVHLLIRALPAVPYTPEVKRELQRCVEVRLLLIRTGTFN